MTDQFPQTVLWTRGEGCAQLAELLASGQTIQVDEDPVRAALRTRADFAVMKRVGSFDLLPVAAPSNLDTQRVSQVIAAVAEGPNSSLAAQIAGRLAERLGVPGQAVSVVRPDAPRAPARKLVERMRKGSGLEGTVIEAANATALLAAIDQDALLVLGAPGGFWLHRQFFGPGARLVAHAPAGTVVVKDAPKRAFQVMSEPHGVARHMRALDVEAVAGGPVLPVVEGGLLVGLIRSEQLTAADDEATVEQLMEPPVYVNATDTVDEIIETADYFEGSAIPLIDRDGVLVGVVDPQQLVSPEG